MADVKKFQINGIQYEVACHTPSQFAAFAFKLASMASGPLATLLLASANGGQGLSELDLSSIDPNKLQQSMMAIAQALTNEELHFIFSKTSRDGKHLGNEVQYDLAYAGNWTEWYKAIYMILRANGFLDFLPTSSES